MTPSLRIAYPQPSHDMDTPRPTRQTAPEPHRGQSTSTFCYPATINLYRDCLRMAQKLREATGELYSFEAACVSYMLDTDRGGTVKAKADYARIWGWTERQLRTRWEEIIATVNDWAGCFGRLDGDGEATDERRRGDGKHPDSASKSTSRDGEATDERRRGDGHTIQLTTPSPTEEKVHAPRPRKSEVQEQCETIYQAYPRKKKKINALKAIEKALLRIAYADLLAATERYAAEQRVRIAAGGEWKHTPYPATWFNAGGYEDEPDEEIAMTGVSGDPTAPPKGYFDISLIELRKRDNPEIGSQIRIDAHADGRRVWTYLADRKPLLPGYTVQYTGAQ